MARYSDRIEAHSPAQFEGATAKPFYQSVQAIAERWGVSDEKASRELEKFRGRPGFMDLGSPGSKNRRKRSIIRIAPSLLEEIERDLRKPRKQ
jgi:hypothetical protein